MWIPSEWPSDSVSSSCFPIPYGRNLADAEKKSLCTSHSCEREQGILPEVYFLNVFMYCTFPLRVKPLQLMAKYTMESQLGCLYHFPEKFSDCWKKSLEYSWAG